MRILNNSFRSLGQTFQLKKFLEISLMNLVDSLHGFFVFQNFLNPAQNCLVLAVKLSFLLNVLTRDPGGHRQHGVEAGQLGEVKPTVSAGPLTRARVDMLLQLQCNVPCHGFLKTARDELINKVTDTLFLNSSRNDVIGDGLQCSTQIFETQLSLPNFSFLNCLQVQEQDTMNMCST